MSILDLSGKLIYTEEVHDINGRYEDRISLDLFAKGTYLLKIESGKIAAVRRIVKD